MSALGRKRTSTSSPGNVRFVPEADIRVRHSYIVSARRPRLLLVWEIPTTIGLWAGPEW